MSEVYECWKCGEEVSLEEEPLGRYYCPDCNESIEACRKNELDEYLTKKIKIMHERALRYMENSQKVYMHEYKEASDEVLEEALSAYDRYQSSHEMIVAIVLKEFGIKYEAQKRVGKYIADFYIESAEVILEVDGFMHKYSEVKDSKRDIEIRNILGASWEVIRIPTEYIVENPIKVIDAIDAIKEYRQKMRRQNFGVLPRGYSKKVDKHYGKVLARK